MVKTSMGLLLFCTLSTLLFVSLSDASKQLYIVSPLNKINYTDGPTIRMDMMEFKEIKMTLTFDKDFIQARRQSDNITIIFETLTLAPKFEILSLNNQTKRITFNRRQLESSKFSQNVSMNLSATYIGHAIFKPSQIEYSNGNSTVRTELLPVISEQSLHVTIVKDDGILGTIFVVTVSFFIIITYINLGAQLDTENLKQIINKPLTIILGFVITVLIMPLVSWFVGYFLLGDQLLYRVGSFIFACGPAATASTLWTVMLDSDKELSIGLQVLSTLGAAITMPVLLYFMDTAVNSEGHYSSIKVPYNRLAAALLTLLIALFIGWRFLGQNEKAQKILRKIYRPLTFFVLIFIIVFSSIVYWYIYIMFNWTIVLASTIITIFTYLISGLLGQLIGCNKDHAITISISSTYKNSGIAFAVLLVAFEAPDTYIAYVPCLTQVVTTSLVLYLIYLLLSLVNWIKRRGQPAPIQATATESGCQEKGNTTDSQQEACSKQARSGSTNSDKSTQSGENDEFIAMNVTDVVEAGSPPSRRASSAVVVDKASNSEKLDGSDQRHQHQAINEVKGDES